MKTRLFLLSLLAGTTVSAQPNVTPVEIIQTTTPNFPWHLTMRGTTSGRARVAVQINAEGKVVDSLVTAYTKRAFAVEALEAVADWSYKPMRIDGQPVGTVTQLDFDFESQGVVVNRTMGEMVEVFLAGDRRLREWEFTLCPLRDLDRIPTPLKVVSPPLSVAPDTKGNIGEVTVQFFIDTQGRVRLPHLVTYTHESLGRLAIDAVAQWQFEVPTRRGEAATVRASQTFKFVAK